MLPVSDQFVELMKSNVRPKCEPVIKVKDALGTGRDLVWTGKNISKMTFKRGIDPIGRTLPFMELRWTEVYRGKLNENNYPQIYENVAAFLPVELKFEQNLGFFNTWKILFDSGTTWKELFDKKITWKQLKEEVAKQEVVFPILFLSGKPVLKDNTIEWVAYDLLNFLNVEQVKYFNGYANFTKVIAYILQNSCSSNLENQDIIQSIQKTISKIDTSADYNIVYPVVFNGKTNSLLKDFLSAFSYYWDFKEDYLNLNFKDSSFEKTNFSFPLTLQYKKPIITKNQDISNYQYKRYYLQDNPSGTYDKEWDYYDRFSSKNDPSKDILIFKYIFNGYGEIVDDGRFPMNGDMNSALSIIEVPSGTVPTKEEYKISVVPWDLISIDENIVNKANGEPFIEDNKFTTDFPNEGTQTYSRFEMLKKYFNKNCDSLEIDCAPNVAIETGDIIKIETNLEDGFGKNKVKNAVVVEVELEYSGRLRQKIKAHEVLQ